MWNGFDDSIFFTYTQKSLIWSDTGRQDVRRWNWPQPIWILPPSTAKMLLDTKVCILWACWIIWRISLLEKTCNITKYTNKWNRHHIFSLHDLIEIYPRWWLLSPWMLKVTFKPAGKLSFRLTWRPKLKAARCCHLVFYSRSLQTIYMCSCRGGNECHLLLSGLNSNLMTYNLEMQSIPLSAACQETCSPSI